VTRIDRLVGLDDIRAARERVAPFVHRTPLLSSATAARFVEGATGARIADGRLYVKAEHLQKTGSFKARGMTNRIATLEPDQRARGAITLSAGNAGQAYAWAGREAGVPITVVMPANANPTKVAACRGYGAEVVLEGDHVNKKWVGKDATLILKEIGVNAPQGTLIAYAEVPENHPFVQLELLTPVTGMVRVRDVDEAIAMAVRCEHGNGHTACMYSRNIAALHAMACVINTSIFTKNAPTYAGLGLGGEGYTSFTISSPTGEGLTNARHFSRRRRCTLKDYFRIV